MSATASFAQINFGLQSDANYALVSSSIKGADMSRLKLPILGEIAYMLPNEMEIPGLGLSKINVGARFGYMGIYDATGKITDDISFEEELWSMPLQAFIRFESQNL